MMKNKTLRFAFFGVVLLALAIAAFSFSFHAGAAAPSVATSSTTTLVSILKNTTGTAYVFSRTKVTITHGSPFQFINRTKITQSVTSNGKTVLTLLTKTSAPYNFTKRGTYTFGLASNSKRTLTVIVQ